MSICGRLWWFALWARHVMCLSFSRMLFVYDPSMFSPRSDGIKVLAHVRCSRSICTIQGTVRNMSFQSGISATGDRLPQISETVLNMLLSIWVESGIFGIRAIFGCWIEKVIIHIHDNILKYTCEKSASTILGVDEIPSSATDGIQRSSMCYFHNTQ